MKYSPTFHEAKRQELRAARRKLERLVNHPGHRRLMAENEVEHLERMSERLEAQRLDEVEKVEGRNQSAGERGV